MKKRTKIIILSAMVLLLGLTGFLNVMLNNQVKKTPVNTTSSYFATYRTYRESTRDQELIYFDAIIASGSSTDTAIAEAKAERKALVLQMEKELVIEGLIKAKGFEDCVITILSQNVNAVVKAKELKSTEVAQIVGVLQTQLGITNIENIKIIPID